MTTKRQREHSQFQTGSGAYDCVICGKKTRDTGHGEDCAEMCRVCFDAAGQVNYLNDNFDGELFRQLFGTDPSGYMETPLCKTPEEVAARSAAAAERLDQVDRETQPIAFTAAGFSLVKTEGSTSYEMTFKLTPGFDNVVEVTTTTTRPTTGRSLNTTNENMTTKNARFLTNLHLDYGFKVKD